MSGPERCAVIPEWVLRDLLAEIDHFEKTCRALCYCDTPHYECPPCAAYRIAAKALTEGTG